MLQAYIFLVINRHVSCYQEFCKKWYFVHWYTVLCTHVYVECIKLQQHSESWMLSHYLHAVRRARRPCSFILAGCWRFCFCQSSLNNCLQFVGATYMSLVFWLDHITNIWTVDVFCFLIDSYEWTCLFCVLCLDMSVVVCWSPHSRALRRWFGWWPCWVCA